MKIFACDIPEDAVAFLQSDGHEIIRAQACDKDDVTRATLAEDLAFVCAHADAVACTQDCKHPAYPTARALGALVLIVPPTFTWKLA